MLIDAKNEVNGPVDWFWRIIRNAATRAFDRHSLGIWAGCSVLSAFSGPFGTYKNHSFVSALIVWSVLLGCAILTAFLMYELCAALLIRLSPTHVNLSFVAVGSMGVAGVIEALLTFWLAGPDTVRPNFLTLWVYVIAIMLIVILVRRVLPGLDSVMSEEGALHVQQPQQPASLPPHSRLAQRLDIPQGTRIIHISADGHFIEVKTCAKSHRVRMRFSDAVAELDETVGLTVHRSHWVHRDAIRGWVPDAVKPYVVLENDTKIPVSKTYYDKLEAAGLPILDAVIA